MKKKREIYQQYNHRKIKRIAGVILFAVLISMGSVMGINSLHNKREAVSAHPTNKIKLDEGGAHEFEIPVDALKLKEQALIDNPSYQNFVQGEKIAGALTRENLESYSEQSGLSFDSVQRTSDGNWIMAINFRNDWYSQNGKPSAFQKYLVKTNDDGEILKIYNVASGENFFTTSNNTKADYRSAVDGGALLVESGKVSLWFQGYSPKEKNEKLRRVTLDENLTPSSASYIVGNFSTSTYPVPPNSVRLFFRKDIVNNDTWYTGNSNVPLGQEATYKPKYSLLRLNNQTGAVLENSNLSFPSLNQLNSTVTNVTKGNVGFQGTQVTKTADGGILMHGWIYHQLTDVSQITPSQHIIKFDSSGTFQWSKDVLNGSYRLQEELSDANNLVALEKSATNNQLVSINTSDGTETVLRKFPIGTDLSILRNPNAEYNSEFDFFGSVQRMEDDFSGYVNGPGVVMGTMNKDYSVSSANFINADAEVIVGGLIANNGTNRYFMYGSTNSKTFSNTPKTGWKTHLPNVSNRDLFFGSVRKDEDYSPIISPSKAITVSIDDPEIKKTETNKYGWTLLDNWLITGSKTGTLADDSSIKVFDNMDSQSTNIAATPAERQEWLEKRINRNPKNLSAAIEWEKLGFNSSITGPQLVTYFVTDSQNQPSTTSRWVNKTGEETIIDKDNNYALDAQNFHIPLNGINAAIPNADKFKELAKTMAWNLTDHEKSIGDQGNGLDEDGTDSSKLSSKVTVDADQLKVLQEATVGKPYPVDVVYQPENGIEIKNRVWVFVTTKNTLPNSETNPASTPADTNGVVYYGDDYSLPFRLRTTQTAADVLNRSNIRVYNYYDNTHETSAELPVLADKTTNPEKLQVVNLDAIHSAARPGLIDSSPPDGTAMIRYEWDGAVDGNHQSGMTKPTLGGIDVTLTGDILLHVRQAIVADSDQLVVPEEGYLRLVTNDYDGVSGTQENPDQLRQTSISSGKNSDNPAFETIAVNVDHMDSPLDELALQLVVPEYYEVVGNYLTIGSEDPNGASHSGKNEADSNRASLIFQRDALYTDEEYFITIYLKPKLKQDGPAPYSWDYKKNNLGKIKTQ
ncbi:hypothetical protein [Enterococcus pallens]|uniref:Uncharacterized protein n=1 Tax=Enterococcus pallens ATCC BAA-351 TaxID=1158607 RepID=R2SFS3_9ENTE|nr:hypothetical protein [Enterococcus pallens]EOH94210.1 hypothetical protein UAU_01945 [Enterococcus pallens ATCC BAA-351]EOU24089.1 hypothetical protein I588_00076 [Enterococcus pallens ATCC BAA-351]OJG82137.1 hypothetical protein RV10_GL002001 [Enterococcus pallens]